MRTLVSLLTALACSASACGYTSSYVAPDGFRARPVYVEDTIKMVGPTELPKCAWEITQAELEAGRAPPPMYIDDSGYWARGRGNVYVGVVFIGPGPPVPTPPGPHNLLFAGMGSSSGGGGNDGQAAVALLAVLTMLAVAAASATAIGMAAAPAEKGDASAEGIDDVNSYNDASRAKIAECMRQVQPGAAW